MVNAEEACGATLAIGDNYGDNEATMRCQHPKGHAGNHREVYKNSAAGQVTVEWEFDERDRMAFCSWCDWHGRDGDLKLCEHCYKHLCPECWPRVFNFYVVDSETTEILLCVHEEDRDHDS